MSEVSAGDYVEVNDLIQTGTEKWNPFWFLDASSRFQQRKLRSGDIVRIHAVDNDTYYCRKSHLEAMSIDKIMVSKVVMPSIEVGAVVRYIGEDIKYFGSAFIVRNFNAKSSIVATISRFGGLSVECPISDLCYFVKPGDTVKITNSVTASKYTTDPVKVKDVELVSMSTIPDKTDVRLIVEGIKLPMKASWVSYCAGELTKPGCTCTMQALMASGCTCGYLKEERKGKK